MIYRHTEEEIQYYFAAPALNQSGIKVILKDGIQKFADMEDELLSTERYYEEKEHFTIGNAVDHIITQGLESFNSKYAYSTLINKPPDTVMSIVRKVFDEELQTNHLLSRPISNNIKDYSEQLYRSCNEHSYYMNRKIPSDKLVKGKIDERTWKDDKRVEGFLGDGTVAKYWEELISSQGKQLLSESEKNKIVEVSYNILNHKHTKNLFVDGKDVDLIYQMPLFFEFNGVMCKVLPDLLRINHGQKKIYDIDIKTMGDYVLRFNQSFRLRRYDIQGSFYQKGVKENLATISKLIGKDISDYTFANPAFVVESTLKPGTPMIYVMTSDLIETGIVGDKNRSYIGGYFQGVEIYKRWKIIDYSIEERFKDTNGIVWVDGQFEYNEIF